ncbi:hypothetical protein ACVXG7_17490 [Enterobacter hormaechei]
MRGNETAPVEIVELSPRALYRAEMTLTAVCWWYWNLPALAQNKRYLVSDITHVWWSLGAVSTE